MLRLAMVIFSIAATSLAGALVVVALVSGYDTWKPIVAAAAVGFVLAMPVSLYVARQISDA